ncbi:TRAP transporter small permease [Roseovarius pacificus]|uniref:TRAP transporter small permease subunit n=1 Tax=Roseovarius pacificus TaxID=337701 RepID=UPI002A1889D6|nr:TRAP transporter small permease [Roseovarius pacificus]
MIKEAGNHWAMRVFRRADHFSTLLSRAAITIAALILVYSVCHILLETVLRSVFATSTHVLDEFIGFAILSMTFLSLSATLRADRMVRVTIISERLSAKTNRWLDAVVSAIGFLLVAYGCLFFWGTVAKNYGRGAVSESVAEVPLWIPDLVVFIGAALLALQLLLRALCLTLSGETPTTVE